MTYLAVDKNGVESIFDKYPPYRVLDFGFWYYNFGSNRINLKAGSIEKLIGKKLTWDDEPVQYE